MLSIFYASAHGISLKKYREDTMNIVEIKTAMDVLKPLFNAEQITELNDMVEVAIANYHDGLTVASINEDLKENKRKPRRELTKKELKWLRLAFRIHMNLQD